MFHAGYMQRIFHDQQVTFRGEWTSYATTASITGTFDIPCTSLENEFTY